MKHKLMMLLLHVLLPASLIKAQSITEEIDPETISSTDAFASFNYSLVRTGFLSDKSIFTDVVADYKGLATSESLDMESWQELYDIMHVSQLGTALEDPDSIMNRISYALQETQVITLGVIDINYDHLETPSETTDDLKAALIAVNNGSAQLKTDVVFAASALKESIYNGSSVQFKLDPSFYYTNKGMGNFTIDIDFGNGQGFRRVAMGETVTVSYSSTGEKNAILKKTNSSGESLQSAFIINVQ